MITQECLHEMFEYKDGILYRKKSLGRTKAGDKVGFINDKGYVAVNIGNQCIGVHRIVWMMQHGYVPECIDHIDGNIHNNKIENLREVTKAQNIYNSKIRKNNSTGIPNVTWYEKTNSYLVRVRVNNKDAYSAYFKDLDLAELVASEARTKFHNGYNRF